MCYKRKINSSFFTGSIQSIWTVSLHVVNRNMNLIRNFKIKAIIDRPNKVLIYLINSINTQLNTAFLILNQMIKYFGARFSGKPRKRAGLYRPYIVAFSWTFFRGCIGRKLLNYGRLIVEYSRAGPILCCPWNQSPRTFMIPFDIFGLVDILHLTCPFVNNDYAYGLQLDKSTSEHVHVFQTSRRRRGQWFLSPASRRHCQTFNRYVRGYLRTF